MDDLMQQSASLQTQATMSELLQIQKESTGVFNEEERRQMEQQYMNAMSKGYSHMLAFGMQRTHFSVMRNGSATDMQKHFQERKDVQQIHGVEESGKQKKKAVRERQAYDRSERRRDHSKANMRSQAEATARDIVAAYEKKKSEHLQLQEVYPAGTEFSALAYNDQCNAILHTDAISDLLLKRDALTVKIKGEKPKDDVRRAEKKYDEMLLEKMNDALSTWMAIGGVHEKGKRLTEKEKQAASQHLALAVEDYEHYAKNRDMIIGGLLLEKVKGTRKYKAECKRQKDAGQASAQRALGIDHPLTSDQQEHIENLRDLIAHGGTRYEANKDLIKQVYGECIQHSIACSALSMEMQAALSVTQDAKTADYLKAWQAKHDYEAEQHTLAIEAAAAYIKYLLLDTRPDPTLAVYIEQHWNTDVFRDMLNATAADLYADREGYAARIRQRIIEVQANTELTEKDRKGALERLESALAKPQGRQAEALVSTSDFELKCKQFCQTDCKVSENEGNGTGYRDILRVILPVSATRNRVSAETVKKYKEYFVRLTTGKYLMDQTDWENKVIETKKAGASCTQTDRGLSRGEMLVMLRAAKADMVSFVMEHEELFQPKTMQQLFQMADQMPAIYKKAQGVRDICIEMIASTYFYEWDQSTKQQLLEIFDFSAGMCNYTAAHIAAITYFSGRSLRDAMGDPHLSAVNMKALTDTLEDAVLASKAEHADAYQKANVKY